VRALTCVRACVCVGLTVSRGLWPVACGRVVCSMWPVTRWVSPCRSVCCRWFVSCARSVRMSFLSLVRCVVCSALLLCSARASLCRAVPCCGVLCIAVRRSFTAYRLSDRVCSTCPSYIPCVLLLLCWRVCRCRCVLVSCGVLHVRRPLPVALSIAFVCASARTNSAVPHTATD
jgi:hypothetical protein